LGTLDSLKGHFPNATHSKILDKKVTQPPNPVAQMAQIARMPDENTVIAGRRHKELHKEFMENVEKQAKTMGAVENAINHKIFKRQELTQWCGSV
jgi:hypothetical protein